jgi:hypothetical protein
MAEHSGHLNDLVEVVDPDDPGLGEDGVVHGVAAGQVSSVGGGCLPALFGAADLYQNYRYTRPGCFVSGQQEGPAVAEALHVTGYRPGVLPRRELGQHVGEIEIHLVASSFPGFRFPGFTCIVGRYPVEDFNREAGA